MALTWQQVKNPLQEVQDLTMRLTRPQTAVSPKGQFSVWPHRSSEKLQTCPDLHKFSSDSELFVLFLGQSVMTHHDELVHVQSRRFRLET